MKTKKMSLSNIKGKLSRAEMKNILAGLDPEEDPCNDECTTNSDCPTDRYCGGGTCPSGKVIKRCNNYA